MSKVESECFRGLQACQGASVLRSVFQFHSDSADVNDVDASDTKYYVFMNNWPLDASLNPAHASMTTTPMLPTAGDVLADKNLVKHDFVRYMAFKLFNTVYGVDLFANENAVLNDISSKGRTAKDSIRTVLDNVSTTSTVTGDHALATDASGNKYTTNTYVGSTSNINTNVCRELIRQIGNSQPSRFNYGVSDASGVDLSGNTFYREVPIEAGDSINFKLTVTPHATQHNLTGRAAAFDSRVYKIRLLVSDTVNTAPVDGTATDLTDYIANA